MSESAEKISEILQAFHRFEDGLLLSFEFNYLPGEKLAAQVLFHARDHRVDGNVWKRVKVVVSGVEELSAKVRGCQFNSICSGVRLLRFDDYWCVDIDGNYALDADPSSVDEIRQDGDLYIIGRDIEVYEFEG
ncbi:hypothetical protein M1B35_00125 [Pseudomonas sp. MAFF 302046]|jgi:hypothetical protein|uniref:Uncharacterized protein n=1 Tax=Pseudomonas morbosilactucae TaxID=2938197 RepID=A0ABT0J9N4_9PSED|nr:hypothetical protein [Pseudomonas morbosilactucae]MCK9812593.1 hypothetical protein [Pseudomonas morbosilactucae]